MRIFNWFKDWATKSKRSMEMPRHPDLHPINVSSLNQKLGLREAAKRLGEGGIPASDAKDLTGPESAAMQAIETYRQGYLAWAVARMNLLSMDLAKINIEAAVNRALNADKEFERKAAGLLSERHSDIQALKNAATRATKELEDFRVANGLTTEAQWPAGTTAFMWYSMAVLLVVIEGILNAGFFAQGLDSGLLGGLTYAGALAFINVGIAFFFGKWVVRNLNHIKLPQKIGGALGLFLALGLIGLVGLSIAHFRDAMTAEAVDPALAAFEALKASPFQLRDILSWGLFILSITFGIIGLADGYKTDDPYPVYGKISRRAQQIVDDFEAEIEDLREQLEELKNEVLEGLEDALRSSQADLAVYKSRIEEKDAAAIRLSTALQNADNSLAALLRDFRNENELHRQGLARPAYFDTLPAMKVLPFPDFSSEADRAAHAAHAVHVQRFINEMEQIRARIQEAFNNQYDHLKPLRTQYIPAEEK
jgi:hypothetical protein